MCSRLYTADLHIGNINISQPVPQHQHLYSGIEGIGVKCLSQDVRVHFISAPAAISFNQAFLKRLKEMETTGLHTVNQTLNWLRCYSLAVTHHP
jgi:hypothetical protein